MNLETSVFLADILPNGGVLRKSEDYRFSKGHSEDSQGKPCSDLLEEANGEPHDICG